ncbi:MAG: hypothetical protein IKR49_03400 [Clostridia bacterium]|nr:hypothetical protein [Clostridia bacterium]
MENVDFSGIFESLSGLLGGINFSELFTAFTETMKQVIEMLKPLLSSLSSGTGDTTTNPAA